MARRIPELPTLTGPGTMPDDLFVVFDADLEVTKRITRKELAKAISPDLEVGGEEGTFGSMAIQNADAVAITGGTITGVDISDADLTGVQIDASEFSNGLIHDLAADLAVADGGTGASSAAGARANLGAAKSGSNGDITALTGLTTDIAVSQGGTGASDAPTARANLGCAEAGANTSITSLAGLTTPLSPAQGGTGVTSLAALATALGALSVVAQSLAANGYLKLNNGLLIQWGSSIHSNYIRTVTWPIAFSGAPFCVVGMTQRSTGGASSGSNFVWNASATGAQFHFDETNSGSNSHRGYWLAIGPA